MSKKKSRSDKVKWARKELSRRTKGKHLSRQENAKIMKQIWNEANTKFS